MPNPFRRVTARVTTRFDGFWWPDGSIQELWIKVRWAVKGRLRQLPTQWENHTVNDAVLHRATVAINE